MALPLTGKREREIRSVSMTIICFTCFSLCSVPYIERLITREPKTHTPVLLFSCQLSTIGLRKGKPTRTGNLLHYTHTHTPYTHANRHHTCILCNISYTRHTRIVYTRHMHEPFSTLIQHRIETYEGWPTKVYGYRIEENCICTKEATKLNIHSCTYSM